MDETPDELVQAKESLLKTVLESYHEEYKRIVNNWYRLEGKAQGSVAIAGIFIAGALAYLRENIALNAVLPEIIAGGWYCLPANNCGLLNPGFKNQANTCTANGGIFRQTSV